MGTMKTEEKDMPKREMLSEREEQLLVRYFDGECGWVEKLLADRLLRRKHGAREFMDTMHVIGEIARNERAGILAKNPQPVNLWDRIESRIKAEEHAAVFLGRRDVEAPRSSWGAKLWPIVAFDHLAWGGSGALVAACLTYVVMHTGPMMAGGALVNSGASTRLARNSENIRQVAFHERAPTRRLVRPEDSSKLADNSRLLEEPLKILDQDLPNALEVDWLKSAGRVRMMQDPGERSAIFWIKRREPAQLALQQPMTSSGVPVVVYNDRLPGSIPVSNR